MIGPGTGTVTPAGAWVTASSAVWNVCSTQINVAAGAAAAPQSPEARAVPVSNGGLTSAAATTAVADARTSSRR